MPRMLSLWSMVPICSYKENTDIHWLFNIMFVKHDQSALKVLAPLQVLQKEHQVTHPEVGRGKAVLVALKVNKPVVLECLLKKSSTYKAKASLKVEGLRKHTKSITHWMFSVIVQETQSASSQSPIVTTSTSRRTPSCTCGSRWRQSSSGSFQGEQIPCVGVSTETKVVPTCRSKSVSSRGSKKSHQEHNTSVVLGLPCRIKLDQPAFKVPLSPLVLQEEIQVTHAEVDGGKAVPVALKVNRYLVLECLLKKK